MNTLNMLPTQVSSQDMLAAFAVISVMAVALGSLFGYLMASDPGVLVNRIKLMMGLCVVAVGAIVVQSMLSHQLLFGNGISVALLVGWLFGVGLVLIHNKPAKKQVNCQLLNRTA